MVQNSLKLMCFGLNDYLKVLATGRHLVVCAEYKGIISGLVAMLTE